MSIKVVHTFDSALKASQACPLGVELEGELFNLCLGQIPLRLCLFEGGLGLKADQTCWDSGRKPEDSHNSTQRIEALPELEPLGLTTK